MFKLTSVLLVFLILSACNGASNNDANATGKTEKNVPILSKIPTDEHSYSNINKIRTKHLALELDINFENKTVYGVARHSMINNGADTAIFDIKALKIQRVTVGKKGAEKEANYVIGMEDPLLGAPLKISIPKNTADINIYYQTTENTEAIDWLPASLTNGKKHPYLYTQGQAILTRTWIPVQCTPAIRITYSADVKVPKELMALMSASNPTEKNETGNYHFEMKQPIPSYLIALAVGDLEYRKLGKNCGVYSEPGSVDVCAREFEDLPSMISAAENLYGKYQWDQYDIIVLPNSFPFGGMENPRLTFANPTLIAGDKSLISVIAHELAHSWSGNLVTNATWNDFWLNEGFTVYFENRIMESLYGKERSDMLALIEFQELEDENRLIDSGENPDDTHLKLNLKDRSPDDGMTSIAYVKGAFFLKTLEEKVGRKEFDKFLKSYFTQFQFKTITTEMFEEFLNKKLLMPTGTKFNTDEWLYGRGIPKNCARVESDRFKNMEIMADKYLATTKKVFKKVKREDFITQEWLAFIRHMPKQSDPKKLAELDAIFNFKGWGNSEIMAEWYVLGINSGYLGIRPEMSQFLNRVGRRKFLAPIYTALASTPANKAWAIKVYADAQDGYHSAKITIEDILGLKVAK